MLTNEKLTDIEERLLKGQTPEEIAEAYSMSRYTLTQHLLQSGKRIVVYRRLENTGPVLAQATEPAELTAA